MENVPASGIYLTTQTDEPPKLRTLGDLERFRERIEIGCADLTIYMESQRHIWQGVETALNNDEADLHVVQPYRKPIKLTP